MKTKQVIIAGLAALLVAGLFSPGLPAAVEAGKPVDVVEWSNGFPSGPHYNLNIHGKKADFGSSDTCTDDLSGGGSIFVPEYGDAEILYKTSKNNNVTELIAQDECSFAPNGDPALILLPRQEYQVYARILAKPNKDGERNVVFYPKLVDACQEVDLDGDGTFESLDCTMGLGIVDASVGAVFDKDGETLVRLPGRSKAVDITDLFTGSFYACDASVDTNGDGMITIADLPSGYPDLNDDGLVDTFELKVYLDSLVTAGTCRKFDSTWVFTIADMVVYGWDYKNNGSKLVQIRFYPTDTLTLSQ